MARDTRQSFLDALEPHLSQIELAFLEAFLDMRSTAAQSTIEEIIRRYDETGNMDRAIDEVRIAINFAARGFYAPLDEMIRQTFIAGGLYQVGLVPKRAAPSSPRLVVRFDGRHERAERWTREQAGNLIDEIAEDTRTVIRETIDDGIRSNRTYRKIATDIIGTTRGNQRKGGVLGLHSSQAKYVRNFRAALSDPEAMKAAFGGNPDNWSYTRRDRRHDRAIQRAIREGKPLDAVVIEKMVGRYEERLLDTRAKTISQTEGNKAMAAGRAEAVQQMIDDGKVRPELVTKVWNATIGIHTRDSHALLHGTEIKWGEQFVSPVTGALLDYPHDEDAIAAETVNCRCTMATRINWAGMAI